MEEKKLRVYIAGRITGLTPYDCHRNFGRADARLRAAGYITINPAGLDKVLDPRCRHEEFMRVCYKLIDLSDAVYMLSNWPESKGARLEHQYALDHGKKVMYEGVNGNEIEALKSNGYTG